MTAIERAAEVLRGEVSFFQYYGPEARDVAEALADAGLLVTDEMRAVLDAAVAYHVFDLTNENLCDAVDEYLATRPR